MVVPPPTPLTPLVWGMQMPCSRSMCSLSFNAATVTPQLVQLTPILFLSLNGSPSPCLQLLLILITPLTLDETGRANHELGLLEVGFKYHPSGKFHCRRQRILHLYPLLVPPRYPAIVGIKEQFPLPKRLGQSVMCLLGFSDHINNRPHHRIHHYIKIMGETGLPCVTPLYVRNASPRKSTKFGTILCRFQ